MRPAPFELLRPHTKQEALEAMGRGATPLAGGQSLLQSMRLGSHAPHTLVDLAGIEELDGKIDISGETLNVGAKTTHRQFAENPLVRAHTPWLAQAAAKIGDVQVRTMGTVLGNLCWADPRANMAVAMLGSDASVAVSGAEDPAAAELIPLSEFFVAYQQTTLGKRLACSVHVPFKPNARGVYLEFSRQPQDLALCNVCVVRDDDTWRVATGGIAQRAMRLNSIEQHLQSFAALPDLNQFLLEDLSLTPPDDAFGDRAYKMQLAGTLLRRAVALLLNVETRETR